MKRSIALMLLVVLAAGCAQLMADSIESLIKQGLELLAQRKFDEAIAKFAEVIRRDPKAWNAWLYTARAYIGKGSWGDALSSSRKALELAPNRGDVIPALAEALVGAGTDALRHGRFADAIGHFTEYVRLRPTDVHGYLNLGRAFLGNGAWGDALRTFVQGLGRTDASGQQQLVGEMLNGGRQALAAGRTNNAIDFLREYVRHDATNASAWLELGRAFLSTGAWGDALRTFVQGMGQTDATGRQQLVGEMLNGGRQALSAGRTENAVEFLREYVRHDGSNSSAWLELGRAYLQSGQVGSAWSAFERVLQLNPNDPEALRLLRRAR